MLPMIQRVIDGVDHECVIRHDIGNVQRSFGATLSHYIAARFNDEGLPDGRSIRIELTGSAGQSFCAFLTKSVKVVLEGDANDYVCKVNYFCFLSYCSFCLIMIKVLIIFRAFLVVKLSFSLLATATRTSSPRRTSWLATSVSTEPLRARPSSGAWRPSASACATPEPPPWSRESEIMAAST